jgi:hypothetical protein
VEGLPTSNNSVWLPYTGPAAGAARLFRGPPLTQEACWWLLQGEGGVEGGVHVK